MDPGDFAQLLQTFGISGIFIALFVRERMINTERTNAHIADLREIAGLRQNLNRVQTYVRDNQFPRDGEMKDFTPEK